MIILLDIYYLHSTMVSINLKLIIPGKQRNFIYIPLWYLLIQSAADAAEVAEGYLHSTMVSINLV